MSQIWCNLTSVAFVSILFITVDIAFGDMEKGKLILHMNKFICIYKQLITNNDVFFEHR